MVWLCVRESVFFCCFLLILTFNAFYVLCALWVELWECKCLHVLSLVGYLLFVIDCAFSLICDRYLSLLQNHLTPYLCAFFDAMICVEGETNTLKYIFINGNINGLTFWHAENARVEWQFCTNRSFSINRSLNYFLTFLFGFGHNLYHSLGFCLWLPVYSYI